MVRLLGCSDQGQRWDCTERPFVVSSCITALIGKARTPCYNGVQRWAQRSVKVVAVTMRRQVVAEGRSTVRAYLWRMVAGVVGSLLLIGGAAFFLTLWLSDTSQWWPTIPGGVMLAWGVSGLLGSLGFPDWLLPLLGFAGSALPFLYIFAKDRPSNWWALIPGGILAMMGVAVTLGELVGGDWVAVFVLWGIAMAFVLVFVANRHNWWALIPAGVLAIVGLSVSPLAPSMELLLPGALIVIGLALVLRVLLGWR
jgi:hypothetical protein